MKHTLSKEARAIRRTDVLHRKNIDKARLNSSDRKPKRRSLRAALSCINITSRILVVCVLSIHYSELSIFMFENDHIFCEISVGT